VDPGAVITLRVLDKKQKKFKMDADEEYDYFKYFVKSENEFYDQNPNFAGMNLLSVAAELKEIATERPHDKDGIIGKSGHYVYTATTIEH
jgi:hypothetical protein